MKQSSSKCNSSVCIRRRSFIKAGSAAVATAAIVPDVSAETQPKVVVARGTDLAKMVEAGIAKLGGWEKFFKPGAKVALKPNLAWKSTPEQGGNTHPDILRAVVLAAESHKVKQVTIPENTCQPEKETFKASGAIDALKGTKANLYRPKASDYKEVDIPKGKICTKAKVPKDILDADCVINMPVAKQHNGATLSISMKNWMGSVDNSSRRGWHRKGLHQCIADFSTFLKPSLIIIDATRIMLNNGPQGPGDLARPHEIIFSTDPVAADTYAASLFGKKPSDVPHIKIAAEMGIGCADLTKVNIVRVEV